MSITAKHENTVWEKEQECNPVKMLFLYIRNKEQSVNSKTIFAILIFFFFFYNYCTFEKNSFLILYDSIFMTIEKNNNFDGFFMRRFVCIVSK